MKTITLEFNFEQLQLLKNSLDLYSHSVLLSLDDKDFDFCLQPIESLSSILFNGLCKLLGGIYEKKND